MHPSEPRPPTGTGEVHLTQRLGDSIHAYAVMAALAAEGRAHSFVAYRPFAALFAGGPLAVVPDDRGTQWWSRPRAFRGPRHGEHVRDTMAKAAGVADHSLLAIALAATPVRLTAHSHVVICPNAGAAYKEWPHDRWGAVVEFLLSRRHEVFICGMPGQPRIRMPAGATHLDRGIAELASLAAGAHALIGPDSGHLHLADALGVPVVGLYGATSSLTYGPYRDRTLCVDTHAEDTPTHGRYSSARHGSGRRMSTISVECVLGAVSRIGR
jgi:hypothetical protein